MQQYIVNAFTDQWMGGNPAAVCVLEEWPKPDILQGIAAQNNLSETAFFVRPQSTHPLDSPIHLRWFTPTHEVDLCGHATLASAHVLFEHLHWPADQPMAFDTRSGLLSATKDQRWIAIELPASEPKPVVSVATVRAVAEALGTAVTELLEAEDYLAVVPNVDDLQSLTPNVAQLASLDRRGVIVTARGNKDSMDDFYSRFFVPKLGVNEDPVTGSAHCQLIPYWTRVLDKNKLSAWQSSARGGRVLGEWIGSRVCLKGQALTFSEGHIMAGLTGDLVCE